MNVLPFYQDWMEERLFSLDCLEVKSVLGQGQYGVVYKATVVDGTARWPVALKCPKGALEERPRRQGSADRNANKAQEELVKEGQVRIVVQCVPEKVQYGIKLAD